MAKNLVQKHHSYFIKISVPRRLRHLFLGESGKPRGSIWEKAGSDFAAAKVLCADRVAWWGRAFARMESGEALEDIKRDDAFLESLRAREQSTLETVRQFLPEDIMRRLAAPQAAAAALASPASRRSGIEIKGETVSQAAEALYGALERDSRRQTTVDGHRLRVRAFVEACGDIPLASITRAMASDWLDQIGAERSNRTRNSYSMTMALVVETARRRGRYQGENPFDGMKAQASGESYQPFTTEELKKLFAALPVEVKPAKHSPESALPWVTLIAAYTGMRLEEIAQLSAADIRDVGANGSTVTVFDIHNGGNNKLKNKASARLVPVHSELVRAGFLDYVRALPKGAALFPGLTRRESKGGKVGARLGELFRKRLVALGLKRPGLVFHSLRHNVATCLEEAGVPQTDAARVLGHAVSGQSYGTYSTGPGLKRLAAVVEEVRYGKG